MNRSNCFKRQKLPSTIGTGLIEAKSINYSILVETEQLFWREEKKLKGPDSKGNSLKTYLDYESWKTVLRFKLMNPFGSWLFWFHGVRVSLVLVLRANRVWILQSTFRLSERNEPWEILYCILQKKKHFLSFVIACPQSPSTFHRFLYFAPLSLSERLEQASFVHVKLSSTIFSLLGNSQLIHLELVIAK